MENRMQIHQLLIVILLGIVFSLPMSQVIIAEDTEKAEETKEIEEAKETELDKEANEAEKAKENKKKLEIENTRLTGIPVTTGIFISRLVDYEYVNRQGKIQNGARSDYSLSHGNVLHYPLFRAFTFHNVSTYLSLGAALGLRGSDISKDLQVGFTGNVIVNSKNFTIVPSFGYIFAPVHRLNCYSVGDDYPEDDKGLTAAVYRSDWFVSLTFSTKIQNLLKDILPDTTSSSTTDNKLEETDKGKKDNKSTENKENTENKTEDN